MELTRRDALAALAAAGVAVGLDAVDGPEGFEPGDLTVGSRLSRHDVATLVAIADVVYPSSVEGAEQFVRAVAAGRADEQPEWATGAHDAVATLDTYAEAWYDDRAVDLHPATRERLLDEMGVDTADPDPDGSDRERVRHFVVNALLFALYASPTGGRLVGIENPPGHPGGTTSYQRGQPDGSTDERGQPDG